MTYLERYLNGEYERVWTDLLQLGKQVHREDVYEDALGVAQETMRRVRKNIEVLIPRLLSIGFIFGYDHRLRTQLAAVQNAVDWQIYYEMLTWVKKQPPVFLPSHLAQESKDALQEPPGDLFTLFHEDAASAIPPSAPPGEDERDPPNMIHVLSILEQQMGPFPLSVRAWYEQVGAVNFYGYHARWDTLIRTFHPDIYGKKNLYQNFLMSYCEPLQVHSLDSNVLKQLQRPPVSGTEIIHQFDFAEDQDSRDYYGGTTSPYIFTFPDARADQTLHLYEMQKQAISFVEYLRVCIRWAGFPGMARWSSVPQDDLTFLTHDLVPF